MQQTVADDHTLPRFEAGDFTGVSERMRQAFERDGVLVLDNMVAPDDCDALKARMRDMLDTFDWQEHRTVFSTTSKAHAQEEYFLSSGHTTRFFFEEGAVDGNGNLTCAPDQALNKLGHAMHDLDPVFDRFSRQPRFRALADGLGMVRPLLLQSMYIYKQPRIGGEVVCHQDATYLWTEPQTCLAFWIALEDATLENGCLWGIPGAHRLSIAPKLRFRRTGDDRGTVTDTLDDTPFDETAKVPLEAPKGTLIAFNGLFPHLSGPNRSDKSRHAYTLHMIDGTASYPADNWLRRPANLPLKGF